MKKIFYTLLLLVVLIIGAIFLAYQNADKLIASFKPELENQVSELLGRKVKFDQLRVEISSDVMFVAENVLFEAASKTEPDFSAGKLVLHLELMPLLEKKLEVKSIELQKASIEDKARPQYSISELTLLADVKSRGVETVLSGTVSGVLAKEFSFNAKSDSFAFLKEENIIRSKDFTIRIFGGKADLDFSYRLNVKKGRLTLDTEAVELDQVSKYLKTTSPQIADYLLGGNITGKSEIEFQPEGFSIVGASKVVDYQGKFAAVKLAGGEGKIQYTVTPDKQLIRSDSIAFKNPIGGERVTGSFKLEFPAILGRATLSSKQVSLATLHKLLKDQGTFIEQYQMQGSVSPSLELRFLENGVSKINGSLVLNSLAGNYQGLKFSDLNGSLDISGDKNTQKVAIQTITARLGSETITAKGLLNLPEIKGNLYVSSGGIQLATLAPLLRQKIENFDQMQLKGVLAPELSFKLSKTPSFEGNVLVSGVEGLINQRPLRSVKGTIHISGDLEKQEISTKNFFMIYNHEHADLSARALLSPNMTRLIFTNLQTFGGSFVGTLDLLKNDRFEADLKLSGIDIKRILLTFAPKYKEQYVGTVSEMQLRLRGIRGQDNFDTLVGDGKIYVTDAVLKGINLPRAVLKKIGSVPVVGGNVLAKIPIEFKPYLEQEDTVIKQLAGDFNIGKGFASVSGLRVFGDIFDLKASGNSSFDSRLLFKTIFQFHPELSALLIQKIKELEALRNSRGMIQMPVDIQGPVENLDVQPDLKRIIELTASKAIEKKAGQILQNLLDRSSNRE